MKNMDKYTVCLLGWYFGYEPKDVVKMDWWTPEDIEKAQHWCELRHIDPIEYWEGC